VRAGRQPFWRRPALIRPVVIRSARIRTVHIRSARIRTARIDPGRIRSARIALAALALATLSILALIGCGSSTRADGPGAATRLAPPRCADATARALGKVAESVYHEIAGGRIALPAAERVASAPTVLAAVEAGRPKAVRAAIAPLLRGQLVRVRITVGKRTLAEYGTANGIAPVSTPLRNAAGLEIGTVTASEEGMYGYASTVYAITEAQVFGRAGARWLGGSESPGPSSIPDHGEVTFRGTRYSVYSFAATGFPKTAMRTFVLAPVPLASACGRTPEETATNAIGQTARKIYRQEQSGPATLAVVRDFEHSHAFQQAVATDNPVATREAIDAFFKTTLHVVRVRATLGEKLVVDVGGPHVLAPIRGDVRDAKGHIVGHFLLSVQDDLGYVILTHRFTGAQVFLYENPTHPEEIVGSIAPAPAEVPTHGTILYGGVRYRGYSFDAEAFPEGQLRVSLLIPPLPGT
jgi:hypothetical protein